jgi:hypothetical protein
MKILITEDQIKLLRRLTEIGQIIDEVIIELNNDIKKGGPGNKPDNFGVYENWLINRVRREFEYRNPKITPDRFDFLLLSSGQFNEKIRNGFNKVKKRR